MPQTPVPPVARSTDGEKHSLAWLRLALEPGVGPVTAHKLLSHFNAPQAVFSASEAQLRQVVPAARARQLSAPATAPLNRQIDQAWQWLQADQHHLLSWDHPHYPARLLAMDAPPIILFAQGRIAALQADALAIVGARHATPGGQANAEHFAGALARAGLVIVSGLAHGIDAAAHQGALAAAGLTVAVVGTGLDTVYPRDHLALAQRIAAQGLLLSEYPPGTGPMAANFPRRNRIIAGLSLGVLVVEAAVRSGSLITARLAADAGREVYAIPGSIHSPVARGCHALIKQGAKLVETAQDILEEIAPLRSGQADPVISPLAEVAASAVAMAPAAALAPSDPLLQHMDFAPITPEMLALRSGLPFDQVLGRLFELEMSGAVIRLAGGRYERRGAY